MVCQHFWYQMLNHFRSQLRTKSYCHKGFKKARPWLLYFSIFKNVYFAPQNTPPASYKLFEGFTANSEFFLAAHVSVILKQGKDPKECVHYRPISLLNLDLKLLAKLLANHLRPFLSELISPAQVGFKPGRKARDNMTKVLYLIYRAWSYRSSIKITPAKTCFS